MTTRAARLFLLLLLLAPSGGCRRARQVYLAATGHQIVRVPTGGMVPTIQPGNLAAVDLLAYEERGPARFDIVMFERAPENVSRDVPPAESTLFAQRIIGLGGETLAISGGRVYVNGEPLAEPFETVPLDPGDEFGPLPIPAGEYFLLGDNRPNSADGRFWNRPTVTLGQIKGRVTEIFQE